MRRAAIVLAALIALCLVMIWHLSPARALQLQCGPLPVLLKQLVDRYQEYVVMTGRNADGSQVVVTRSDGGTFTVLLGDGKGACVVLSGDKAELDKGI